MQSFNKVFKKPETEFYFAGFDWPRFVPMLPKGDFRKRIERHKRPVCGPYYHAPKPLKAGDRSTFCYLDSDFMPALRWSWCDEIPAEWSDEETAPDIKHTGWFIDSFDQSETIRGIVFKLPGNRGFLSGWSMGEGMATVIDCDIIPDIRTAVYGADSMAENTAESEREYREETENEEVA